MRLKHLELNGFKSFSRKTVLEFGKPIVAIVGPNGSGKSNVVEAIRFVLGEQSMKSMRGGSGADMIFKGSKNLPKSSRAAVSIYFNNSDKVFQLSNEEGEKVNLNYETVSIGREVFSDGLNEYLLNGEGVRLKDVNSLLASVNIGSSGHHIISQGEADRILNANPRERREMVEDALGLKIYRYRIRESERKLLKTEENMKEVSMLRRENAPHLNFLKKQMEKLDKAKEIQEELKVLYFEYFRKESSYLKKEGKAISREKSRLEEEIKKISSKISLAEREGNISPQGSAKIGEIKTLEQEIIRLRAEGAEKGRQLGRIEGMLEAKENRVKVSGKCPMCGSILAETTPEQIEKKQNEEREVAELKNSRDKLLAELENGKSEEKRILEKTELLKREVNKEMESMHLLEKEKFSLKVKEQELNSALQFLRAREDNLSKEALFLENEIKEGVVLVGEEILRFKKEPSSEEEEDEKVDRVLQEEARKKIERIKIRLEDMGAGGGEEVAKEFKEVSERDEFLAKELLDLEKSVESINSLIAELKEKIDVEFRKGIERINKEFQNFFALMFGGGTALLSVVAQERRKVKSEEETEALEEEEEEETEEGLAIEVSLPHKKVRELDALSGGERSLTSIAVLFAMSYVNPPPFLVLDETDAALDEANSRKYGDMLELLSKNSQLVVVTHNRETMSRAGILYGVTIGADGASKILSVKLEEAEAIAK